MLMTFVLIGGGAYLMSNILNKAMSGPNAVLFGQYPANQFATLAGVAGLLLAPVFGPLAPLVSFASTISALGGIVSVMKTSGVPLLPRKLNPSQISGYGYDQALDVDEGYPAAV